MRRITVKDGPSTRPFGISSREWQQLIENGLAVLSSPDFPTRPVTKLSLPDGTIFMLLAELDPEGRDLAFGLLNISSPMLRFVSLSELAKEPVGLTLHAEAYRSDLTLIQAAQRASRDGGIKDYAADQCPGCIISSVAQPCNDLRRVRLGPLE